MGISKLILGGLGILGVGAFLGMQWINSQQQEAIAQVQTQISELESRKVSDLNTLKAKKNQLEAVNIRLDNIPNLPIFPEPFELQTLGSKLEKIEAQLKPETQALENLESAQKLAMSASVLVQNPPHPTQVWLDAQQQWEQAINLLKGIPKNTYAYLEAQKKMISYGQNYEIISVRATQANQAVQLNNKALKQIELGEYKQAIQTLNQATKLNPGLIESYLNRGGVYVRLNSHQSAIANFDQALKINPESPEAYLFRGEQYLKIGDYGLALWDYNQVIKLNPNHTNAYLDRGYIYRELKEPEKAIADFKKASELLGNDGDIKTQQLTLSIVQELEASRPVIVVETDDNNDYQRLRRKKNNYSSYSGSSSRSRSRKRR
ncbi:tetratricopeptide repeat protein [Planktothrix agardhii]|uniref:tetratricopeptide repeat protein n=1 Tax=Planktothrix agardhii TaxID=1160 RepID=UPI001D09F998|nr:tetratricopeptide repeat protein [Planktothrix agardhii]MCB8787658.1 tetratricopeptide repeat protein [Planktothrix agardhii 1025]MCF3610570.1 tetratricopeptide repeat protein [Planktothrix agardhii 1027]MCF3644170.1 tetratricopeptide repeat protein [Planktothrix agardhii 1026]CAD5916682.1 TPR repeat-containing protein slr0751 [Planktothrix agardhii]